MLNSLQSLKTIVNHPLNKKQKIKTLLRIFWWKINQLLFKYPCLVSLTPKVNCLCYPNSSFGGLVVYTKYPEYQEMNFVLKHLKEESIFIDVGANIGVYSLLAASKITKGKIYAFEPSVNILPNLYLNIRLNNLTDRIVVIEKVVTDKDGIEKFSIGNISETNHISYIKEAKKTRILEIPSVTLDNFIKQKKIKHLDMVKIDVEGAELAVLKGFYQTLKNKMVDIVILEINKKCHLYGYSTSQIINFLKDLDFEIFVFNEQGSLKKMNQERYGTYNILAFQKLSRDKFL